MNEMRLLALDIYQYCLLPRNLDGGGGSFRGYRLTDDLSKTANATYSVTVKDDVVTIHAESIVYPMSSVEAMVDNLGRLVGWKYAGGFEH